jgi:hypothetical protein
VSRHASGAITHRDFFPIARPNFPDVDHPAIS